MPTNSVPTVPLRLEHPLRVGHAAGCFLISCFVANVHGAWVDCAGAVDEGEVDALWKVGAEVFPAVVEYAESERVQVGFEGTVPTMLWAATDWIARLDLPEGEAELWEGPPILRRGPGRARRGRADIA